MQYQEGKKDASIKRPVVCPPNLPQPVSETLYLHFGSRPDHESNCFHFSLAQGIGILLLAVGVLSPCAAFDQL